MPTVTRNKSGRLRDNRRQKIYDAGWTITDVGPLPHLKTKAQCQKYVDRIIRSQWWVKRFGRGWNVEVGDGRRHRSAKSYGDYIALPLWARNEAVILHELTHEALRGYDICHHGPEFARVYLEMVKRFMGHDKYIALRAAYKTQKVKVARNLWQESNGKRFGRRYHLNIPRR